VTTYRIRNWDKHFENNRTRELKKLDWVPVPNKHDGDGFTELLDHKNGMAHYGAWHLILQVASKCDPRGTLLRDSAEGCKIPHTPQSLARITRGNAIVFNEVLPRLLTIGWIESCDNPASSCDNPAPECGKVPIEGNGMEGKRIEHIHSAVEFNSFWISYPKKTGKKAAQKAWDNAKDKPVVYEIIAAIDAQRKSAQWIKDGGQYIPNPATWINQGRWMDKPTDTTRAAAPVIGRVKMFDEWVSDLCADMSATTPDKWQDVIHGFVRAEMKSAHTGKKVREEAMEIMTRCTK